MRQIGPNQFEITNKKTGQTKVVKGEELSSYGLSKPSTDKKGGWIPVAGGIIGGAAGLIGGPVGAGLGAAAGTMGGTVIRSALYGNQNKEQGDFTGNTKYGFPELSQQGRKNQAMEVVNATKDAAIAGATTYVGAKIPVMGPNGKTFMSTVGRIGTKTAAGAGAGAVAGFGQGDLQDTSLQERTSNAKTGAIIGGVSSGLVGTGQEAVNAIKNINKTQAGINLAKSLEKVKDKVSTDKKIWNMIVKEAGKSNEKISNADVVNLIKERAKTDFGASGKDYKKILSMLADEDISRIYSAEEAAKIGARLPFSVKTGPLNNWFRNTKKDVIGNLLPDSVSDLKKLYSLNKQLKKPVGWLIKKIAAGSAIGTAGAVGYNILKK